MITRNHPVVQPQRLSVFSITLTGGEHVKVTAHYATTGETREAGVGIALWELPSGQPVCTAFYPAHAVQSITLI